jgi:hypothetical protein
VDVDGWHTTIAEIRRRAPQRLALIHFGVVEDVERHLGELDRRLDEWVERVQGGASEQEFEEAIVAKLRAADGDAVETYTQAMPLEQSYAGLRRYVDKRAEAA